MLGCRRHSLLSLYLWEYYRTALWRREMLYGSDPLLCLVTNINSLQCRRYLTAASPASPSLAAYIIRVRFKRLNPVRKEEKRSNTNSDRALPKLKPASSIPSRLHMPQAGKVSPPSSRNSSISGKSSPPRGQRERGSPLSSPGRGLMESFESSLGEQTDPAGGRRVLVSASSG